MTMTDRPRLGAKFAAPGIQRPAALAGLLATDPEPATTNRPEPPSAVVNGVAPPTARDRPVGTRGRGKATDRTSEQRWPAGNKIVPVVLDASILTELRAFAN